MVPPSSKSNAGRKTSLLNMLSFRSASDPRPSTAHSTNTYASHSGLREAPSRFRALYQGTFRDPNPAFELMSPATSAPKQPPPPISKLAKSFADSLTSIQLSKFFAWFLYYDIVDLPASSDTWFSGLDVMEVRGWIALGQYLSQVLEAGTGCGFNLVVLDSICDRMRIERATVHAIIMHFANPAAMAFTQVATIIRAAEAAGKPILATLDTVHDKLVALRRLTVNLRLEEESMCELWRELVLNRIRGLLQLVIVPQIRHHRFGVPLVMASTSEQLPQEVKDGIVMKFRWEAIQLERPVPLFRYGIRAIRNTPTVDVDREAEMAEIAKNTRRPTIQEDVIDLGVNLADTSALMREVRKLRGQVARLARDKNDLIRDHNDLIRDNNHLTIDNRDLSCKNQDLTYKNEDLTYDNEDIVCKSQDLSSKNKDLTRENKDLVFANQMLKYEVTALTLTQIPPPIPPSLPAPRPLNKDYNVFRMLPGSDSSHDLHDAPRMVPTPEIPDISLSEPFESPKRGRAPTPFPRTPSPEDELLLLPPYVPPIPPRSSLRMTRSTASANRRSGFVSYDHLLASVDAEERDEVGMPPPWTGEKRGSKVKEE